MRRETRRTPHGTDAYMLMDASEIPGMVAEHERMLESRCIGWSGETSFEVFRRKTALGDNDMVEESERFLASIEDQIPISPGWRVVDDVVGAVPNVPAFLAGHPQSMRRRQRAARETAPLAIYMDLTSSGGISAGDVMRRGVVLLALTRMLVEHRAVELWVGASLGGGDVGSGTVAWRIDTTPLDLARAAYHVAATPMSRGFGYGLSMRVLGTDGRWPFHNYDLHCRTAADRLRPVLGLSELLYVPPIMVHDDLTQNPVAWLRRVMAQYVQTEE